MKYTALAEDKSAMDAWSQSLTAPDWGAASLAMSTPRFFLAQSLPELRAIRASPDPPPSAVRQFRRSDRVLVAVDCYTSQPGDTPLVQAHVLTREGKELTELPVPLSRTGRCSSSCRWGASARHLHPARSRHARSRAGRRHDGHCRRAVTAASSRAASGYCPAGLKRSASVL